VPPTLESIVVDAMKLSPEERADLADLLWSSVEPNVAIEMAWNAEIQRRIADLEAGRTEAIPGDRVLAELRAMIEAHPRR
jgi:putative addiction module component (TIGR02574 family)